MRQNAVGSAKINARPSITWSFLLGSGRIIRYGKKKAVAKISLVHSRDSGYFFYGDLDHSAGIQINTRKSLAVSLLVSLGGVGCRKDHATA